MTSSDFILGDFLDLLNVGLSMLTFKSEDYLKAEWVFVNAARCRLSGHTRDELLQTEPMAIWSRESLAQVETIKSSLELYGRFVGESVLIHKTRAAIPVMLYCRLIERENRLYLLTEHHDIQEFKENETRLDRARANTRDLLKLIDQEKTQLRENIRENVGLVALPLLNQLRTEATGSQGRTLDLLENRIRHVTSELGVMDGHGWADSKLTRRQILICELIRDGLRTKDIARILGCSPSTINNHRNAIRRKLGLKRSAGNLEVLLNRGVQRDDPPDSE